MKKWIYIMSLLLAPFFMLGQSFDVSVSSDSILIGNYIELKIVAKNIEGDFEAPLLENLIIRSGPNTSQFFSESFYDDIRTSETTWTYNIEPTIEGEIIIPPAYLVTEDKTYETAPTSINVFPNPDGIIEEPKSGDSFFRTFEFPSFMNRVDPPRTAPKKEPSKNKKSSRQIKRI